MTLETIVALELRVCYYMVGLLHVLVYVVRFVTPSGAQWKRQISAVVNHETSHDCNVLSLFTNSKLFQRLLCIGVSSSDLCKLSDSDNGSTVAATGDPNDCWLAALNARNTHR